MTSATKSTLTLAAELSSRSYIFRTHFYRREIGTPWRKRQTGRDITRRFCETHIGQVVTQASWKSTAGLLGRRRKRYSRSATPAIGARASQSTWVRHLSCHQNPGVDFRQAVPGGSSTRSL